MRPAIAPSSGNRGWRILFSIIAASWVIGAIAVLAQCAG
jgi:hypothetical protein